MARGKKSLDLKRRERRERLQAKHSDKTSPGGCVNEKDSAADKTVKTHNIQHSVEHEGADDNSKEQLDIEKSTASDLSVENCDRHSYRTGVKRPLEESDDKNNNNENSLENSSVKSSYKTNVNNEIESVLTNKPISDMSKWNECRQDYKTNYSTLFTECKEWTGAFQHQSDDENVHDLHDFDSFFQSWTRRTRLISRKFN